MEMLAERARMLKGGRCGTGPVIYWMSRDQRCNDNWALLFAQERALELKVPLLAVFMLAGDFLGATMRQYSFMLAGLAEAARDFERLDIPLIMLRGVDAVAEFARHSDAAMIVADFDPLRIKGEWHSRVATLAGVDFWEVDAHNIVPCFHVSLKQEYGAYTIRPKINRQLDRFLTGIPKPRRHPFLGRVGHKAVDWKAVLRGLKVDATPGIVDWIIPGAKAARRALDVFIGSKLHCYEDFSRDPVNDCQSNLSPYLHFGQISAQRVALAIRDSGAPPESKAAFLEQLIVRRELSDNYCLYAGGYDSLASAQPWAAATLAAHSADRRQYLYSRDDFEAGDTHDELWNAAQLEMVRRGKMHGYMRMYWAKKILEWSASPAEAFATAVYLNDRYELDGRDPNGYAGIAWAIAGTHDRAWGERPVFGKIRYMSYGGCRAKFDIDAYIKRMDAR